ncbi:MAG: serine/threonine protein kinase bacterial, partial [bacterium]
TVIGEVFGTPQYMAPEQLMEESIGPSADIYALGIIVYEMLAGELPFNSLDPKEVYLFKTEKVTPELSQNYPFIPKAFDSVIRKAIDYDPKRRYQNAEDFIKEFEVLVEKYPEGRIVSQQENLAKDKERFLEDSQKSKKHKEPINSPSLSFSTHNQTEKQHGRSIEKTLLVILLALVLILTVLAVVMFRQL